MTVYLLCFLFFKQKTAYEMRISDWSSDVCSSDLKGEGRWFHHPPYPPIDAPHQSAHLPSMTIAITPSGQACGARVTGVDLTRPLATIGRAPCRESVCQYV